MASAERENGTPLPMQSAAGVATCCGNMRPATRLAKTGVGLAAVQVLQARERLCHFPPIFFAFNLPRLT